MLVCGAAASVRAQDQTYAWLRYAVRLPLDTSWTWHTEPDYRGSIAPHAGDYNQLLLRSDMQRRLNAAHTIGVGLVGVWAETRGQSPILEWRPQLTWFMRPSWARDLMLRGRMEWRQQSKHSATAERSVSASTLRCRALVQYDAAFRRSEAGMTLGLRNQAELLARAFSSNFAQEPELGFFDQLRISTALVARLAAALEMEATWFCMVRDNGLLQQWFRLQVVQQLGLREPRNQ